MSWFDATGFASLAKTALKEAQKTIDKALDIKDDEEGNGGEAKLKSSTSVSELGEKAAEAVPTTEGDIDGGKGKTIKQSVSNPILSTVATGTTATNLWDSFTGSFFDASNASDDRMKPAVTIAPSSTSELRTFEKRETTPSNAPLRTTSANTSGRTSSASVSESVEVLSSPITPSSGLTSPSTNFPVVSSSSCTILQHSQTPSESIEVIDSTDSPDTTTNELVSPDSVISTTTALTPASCPSISDSVEIIDGSHVTSLGKHSATMSSSVEEMGASQFDHVDDDDDESMSVSYNTVSESTAPVTIKDTCQTGAETEVPRPITTPPSRTSLTLTLAPTHQPSIKATKAAVDSKLKAPTERLVENFEAQTQLSDSTHSFEDVQQMLLDEASVNQNKKATVVREGSTSPQSSDDRLDLVKINAPTQGDAHHSGHTSADEVETATSSDIEIISGPNGDSSSTNSIAGIAACKSSPMKMSGIQYSQYVVYGSDAKRKGHNRELSGTSSYSMQSESGSDAHSVSEIEKLHQRIAELAEVIEVREYKLVELGRENAQLHEMNAELKHQLDGVQSRADATEATTLAEEYTQRMSALERKFQQTLRERDSLRAELKTIQNSLSRSISKEEIDRLVKEKNEMIEELSREGEKLSKQILQHSTLIKKLRAKEKESDAQIKRQAEQIDELTSELDRSKKSLSAKDEVERTQMEAVHKLTSENKRLGKELSKLRSEFDDTVQRLLTQQTSLDAAKTELSEKRQEMHTMLSKTKNLTTLQSEHQQLQQQNQQMAHELETLRDKLKSGSAEQSGQHQKLRQENAELVRRLEQIEQRAEDHAQAIGEATIPLVRQCDALQSTLNSRTAAWEKQELAFVKKIEALERQLANVSVVERTASEQTEQLNARIQNLEDSLSQALLRSEQAATALQQKQMELDLLQSDARARQATTTDEQRKSENTIDELTAKVAELQEQLKSVREQNEQKRALNASQVSETKADRVGFHGNSSDNGSAGDTSDKCDRELSQLEANSSPTVSVAGSNASNQWPMDDIDSVSMIGGHNRRISTSGSLYGTTSFGIGGSSALIEMLQSTLKQRDGENHQLQWQLSRLQSERNFLMSEVAKLNEQLENVKDKLATHDSIVSQFAELQTQYDAMMQMYGEKVEETEELQLDLQDVKDMYRAQIDDLLVQQRQLTQQLYTLQESRSETK